MQRSLAALVCLGGFAMERRSGLTTKDIEVGPLSSRTPSSPRLASLAAAVATRDRPLPSTPLLASPPSPPPSRREGDPLLRSPGSPSVCTPSCARSALNFFHPPSSRLSRETTNRRGAGRRSPPPLSDTRAPTQHHHRRTAPPARALPPAPLLVERPRVEVVAAPGLRDGDEIAPLPSDRRLLVVR